MESILTSVKKMLGITENCEDFDFDIIFHINSVFSILNQLGVGPSSGFTISDKSAIWTDFLGEDKRIEMVKSYMFAKVRMIFDPPQSTAVMEALKAYAAEFESRINYVVD